MRYVAEMAISVRWSSNSLPESRREVADEWLEWLECQCLTVLPACPVPRPGVYVTQVRLAISEEIAFGINGFI